MIGDEYLLAPLWSQVLLNPFVSVVSVATSSSLVDSNPYLNQTSNFISNKTNSSFTAEWMMVAQWRNIGFLNDQYGNDSGRVSGCGCNLMLVSV